MKIKKSYKKLITREIRVEVSIADNGDFPTANIFLNDEDYPSEDGFLLCFSNTDTIGRQFKTVQQAIGWADNEIKCLKFHLDRWRSIKLPQDTEVEI